MAAFDEGIGPWTTVALRVAIAAILVIVFLASRGLRRPDHLTLKIGTVLAVGQFGIASYWNQSFWGGSGLRSRRCIGLWRIAPTSVRVSNRG